MTLLCGGQTAILSCSTGWTSRSGSLRVQTLGVTTIQNAVPGRTDPGRTGHRTLTQEAGANRHSLWNRQRIDYEGSEDCQCVRWRAYASLDVQGRARDEEAVTVLLLAFLGESFEIPHLANERT